MPAMKKFGAWISILRPGTLLTPVGDVTLGYFSAIAAAGTRASFQPSLSSTSARYFS